MDLSTRTDLAVIWIGKAFRRSGYELYMATAALEASDPPMAKDGSRMPVTLTWLRTIVAFSPFFSRV